MKNLLRIIFAIAVITVCIYLCLNSVFRPSIFEISNCELPCWEGLTTGATDFIEAKSIITENPHVIQRSLTEINTKYLFYENRLRFTVFDKWGYKTEISTEIYFVDNIVSKIHLGGELGITLQEVIDKIGPPDYVFADWGRPGKVYVNILFPEVGVHLVSIVEDEFGVLSKETLIQTLDIFDPQDYDKLLSSGEFHAGVYDPEAMINHQWVGYGVIEDNYWPPNK